MAGKEMAEVSLCPECGYALPNHRFDCFLRPALNPVAMGAPSKKVFAVQLPYVKPDWPDAPPVPISVLPTDPQERKGIPMCSGVLDYFPLALAEIAKVSKAGNDQHNPGQPLHWSRGKSTDFADTILRHLVERGSLDTDGLRHTAKAAWRILAMLQIELEEALGKPISRGSKP